VRGGAKPVDETRFRFKKLDLKSNRFLVDKEQRNMVEGG
jgi:hypothetical protein